MSSLPKIEQYLIDLGISYQEISKNAWLIEDENKGYPKMMVSLSDPVVIISADVMPVPKENAETLFRMLLELNATDLLHGAYAITGNDIIVIDTLEHASLDKDEFLASIESISFALLEHYKKLASYIHTTEE
ncbi:MAG: type III secretion system chaperone family protein [Rectinema subterraneum]